MSTSRAQGLANGIANISKGKKWRMRGHQKAHSSWHPYPLAVRMAAAMWKAQSLPRSPTFFHLHANSGSKLGIASGTRVLSDEVENVLIRQGHETISLKCETITALIHLHFSSLQVFVSQNLQRY